jgi:hypothetical protein
MAVANAALTRIALMMNVCSKNQTHHDTQILAKRHPRSSAIPNQPAKHAQTPPVKNMNGAKCYICGQPNHLANACPSKGKIKASARSSLKTNKIFMALWQNSFADHERQQCATRILKSWGDDVCPTCMTELSFDHPCYLNDISIAKHANTVRDVLRSTPLLETIQSAHTFVLVLVGDVVRPCLKKSVIMTDKSSHPVADALFRLSALYLLFETTDVSPSLLALSSILQHMYCA